MNRRLRRMLSGLLLGVLSTAGAPAAVVVSLDTSTTLLDLSLFTPGATYYAAWQLTGSGQVNNTASVSAFDLGGGTGLDRDAGDPLFGIFTLGPNAASNAGVWQSSATLDLLVNPLDSFSLYSQRFVAGTAFEFLVDFTTNQLAGFPPDAFTFQLYDGELETLLYEVSLDLLAAGEPIPEPSAWSLVLLGAAGLAAQFRRRRGRPKSPCTLKGAPRYERISRTTLPCTSVSR